MHDQDKEKFLAIVILVVVILGALGYFLWNFALNKGTIIFNGNPPYTIIVDSKEYDCQLEACELVIKEGKHTYKITKEGYNSLSGTIQIARGEEFNINVELTYIPVISQPQVYTMYRLPEEYADLSESLEDISLFKTYDVDYPLEGLPEDLISIVFSWSGEKALLFEGDRTSTYQVADYVINRIGGLGETLTGAFTNDESFFYTIAFDEDSNKDTLKRIPFTGETFETMVYFNRSIEDYELEVSPNEKYAFLSDKTGETTVLYLINLERKERTNVYEGISAKLGKFSDDSNYFVFEGRSDNEDIETLKYLNLETKEVKDMPFEGNLKMFDFAKGPFGYFVTDTLYESRGVFVDFKEENFEILTVDDLFEDQAQEANPLRLFKWDPVLNEYYMIANLNDFFPDQKPSRIEASEDGKDIRFLVDENVYDLMLAE